MSQAVDFLRRVPPAVAWRVEERTRGARQRARELTAPARVRPNFLIIGALKGGTTSLHRYLSDHPAVYCSTRKEVHYFSLRYHHGERWYLERFLEVPEWQPRTYPQENVRAYPPMSPGTRDRLRAVFSRTTGGSRSYSISSSPGLAPDTYPRARFRSRKPMFAGRSARRRMRYRYQSGPYGVATSTGYPRRTRDSWS